MYVVVLENQKEWFPCEILSLLRGKLVHNCLRRHSIAKGGKSYSSERPTEKTLFCLAEQNLEKNNLNGYN